MKIGVVLQHRFRAAAERLTVILAEGQLGKIVNCSTRIPLWRNQDYYDEPGRGVKLRDGGGVLMTQAIHTLDLMLSLAGPVEEVYAMTRTTAPAELDSEELVFATIRFKSSSLMDSCTRSRELATHTSP